MTTAEERAKTSRDTEELLGELRVALENSMTGISLLDPDGRFIVVREGYAKMLGYTPSEMLGMSWEAVVPPEDHQAAIDGVMKMLDEGRSAVEIQALRKDGSRFIKQLLLVKKLDDAGRHIGHYCFMRDVTERHELERQLRHVEKAQVIGQLTAGVAHNFNNALQVILANVELGLVEGGPGVQGCLSDAKDASLKAMDVVRQLMLYARDRAPSVGQPANLSQIVGRVHRMCEQTFDRLMKLELELPDTPMFVAADGSQLETVYLNLLLNARDALEGEPRPRIWTRLERTTRQLGGLSPEPVIALEVGDNGPGIPVQIRDRVFDPFFTTKEIGKGTGLGLSTARAMVEQHGGEMRVESSPAGTTFFVYLPCTESVEYSPPGDDPKLVRVGRILLVEDEEPIREALARVLSRAGHDVIVARDGDEAIELFEKEREELELIVLDLSLPGRSGREVLDRIRVLSDEVRVLILSGSVLPDETIDGADAILSKPVERESLLTGVSNALATRR